MDTICIYFFMNMLSRYKGIKSSGCSSLQNSLKDSKKYRSQNQASNASQIFSHRRYFPWSVSPLHPPSVHTHLSPPPDWCDHTDGRDHRADCHEPSDVMPGMRQTHKERTRDTGTQGRILGTGSCRSRSYTSWPQGHKQDKSYIRESLLQGTQCTPCLL